MDKKPSPDEHTPEQLARAQELAAMADEEERRAEAGGFVPGRVSRVLATQPAELYPARAFQLQARRDAGLPELEIAQPTELTEDQGEVALPEDLSARDIRRLSRVDRALGR